MRGIGRTSAAQSVQVQLALTAGASPTRGERKVFGQSPSVLLPCEKRAETGDCARPTLLFSRFVLRRPLCKPHLPSRKGLPQTALSVRFGLRPVCLVSPNWQPNRNQDVGKLCRLLRQRRLAGLYGRIVCLLRFTVLPMIPNSSKFRPARCTPGSMQLARHRVAQRI